jgi:hypothetical protein
MKLIHIAWFVFVCLLQSQTSFAGDQVSHFSERLSPDEYLWRSMEPRSSDAFDNFKTIDLSADLGIGADCGRVDFKNTLRSSLQNILDTKYFGTIGSEIIGASPMLMACYFSPTWCAILKHSQINANMLSQMRLNQCSIIDKYTDKRSEDFFQERQGCVRKAIDENGGDMERAMESCRGNVYSNDLASWAGSGHGEKSSVNRLIDSSAKWAGISDNNKNSVDLVKALVGDTVVTKGTISIDYGPSQSSMTPRTFLRDLEKTTQSKLCGDFLKRAVESEKPIDQVISNDDLKSLNPVNERELIDLETIRSLTYLPPTQRQIACEKLADSVSLTIFANEMSRSLDILSTLSQNPNLPDSRRQELDHKRASLKDSIELTMSLYDERHKPLNTTLSQINEEATRVRSLQVRDNLVNEESDEDSKRDTQALMDCADNVMCERN